jgi:hypothetical protein
MSNRMHWDLAGRVVMIYRVEGCLLSFCYKLVYSNTYIVTRFTISSLFCMHKCCVSMLQSLLHTTVYCTSVVHCSNRYSSSTEKPACTDVLTSTAAVYCDAHCR